MQIKGSILLLLYLQVCGLMARIHRLKITNDGRKYIALSTFGFYRGGILDVQLKNFYSTPENTHQIFGFSLDRTKNDAMNPYLDNHQESCILENQLPRPAHHEGQIIYFVMDLVNKKLKINCSTNDTIHIYKAKKSIPALFTQQKRRRRRRQVPNSNGCSDLKFDIVSQVVNNHTLYNASFALSVKTDSEEGLYNLYFYSCPNYRTNNNNNNQKGGGGVLLDFEVEIIEMNMSSYLSAGEMPLPALYSMMAILFFLSGMFWVFLLKQSRHPVFKIHYMMAVLVFLKSVSLAFHGVNYHYIERLGMHMTTWAVLFYIAHLLKGALLFVILILIGTGWTFIKHVLAPRDKRLFMAIIPLQVLANVAKIILEEGEEGARDYTAWRNVFTLVDLLCCGCIMFPVVWSIRHLQEAAQTDGKAAQNLRKLKLFRHFYVMIVCYIYSTRIIVYLLRITVPFQYEWFDEMFKEMATYVFFVLTAYKFRPAAHNPYFALNDDDYGFDDDGDDVEQVLTESGATESLSKVNSRTAKAPPPSTNSNSSNATAILMTEVTEEEKDALLLLNNSESSHDYD